MKAELCPVCAGSGRGNDGDIGTASPTKTCQGCGGSGWVTVPEDSHVDFPGRDEKEAHDAGR